MKLRIDTRGVLAGLAAFGSHTRDCLGETGRSSAALMEDYAKQNRPWKDRTGNARRTLEGVCGWNAGDVADSDAGNRFRVGVEGHMPYSVFLELGFDGRFSVLAPTVHHFAPQVLLDFAQNMSDMK